MLNIKPHIFDRSHCDPPLEMVYRVNVLYNIHCTFSNFEPVNLPSRYRLTNENHQKSQILQWWWLANWDPNALVHYKWCWWSEDPSSICWTSDHLTSDKSIDQTNVPTHLGSSCLILDDCFLFLDQELNLDRKMFWQYSNLCRRYPIVMSHRLLFELITLVVVRVNSISQSHSLVPGWSMIIICYNVTLCQILPGHGVLLLLLLLPLREGAHQLLPSCCQLSRGLVRPEKVGWKISLNLRW